MAEQADELTEGRAGTVTIAPSVLVTIARLSALDVPGVCRMSERTPSRLLDQGSAGQGARIQVAEGSVTVDLFVVAKCGQNVLQVGRDVQSSVTRAIREMVGMEVREVNVHIGDVESPCPKRPSQER
jgi:uncharacterized alkaline shock family protein YloU